MLFRFAPVSARYVAGFASALAGDPVGLRQLPAFFFPDWLLFLYLFRHPFGVGFFALPVNALRVVFRIGETKVTPKQNFVKGFCPFCFNTVSTKVINNC
jgi:hypothetical protein